MSYTECFCICEGEVTETAREHLLRILEENNVSSNTSAQLNKIMGSLQNIVEATESYLAPLWFLTVLGEGSPKQLTVFLQI